MSKEILFWDTEDTECLQYTEIDPAIKSALDGMIKIKSVLDGMDSIDDLPETLEMRGYARLEPNIKIEADNVLYTILESLDEEFGNPDSYPTKATDNMKTAAKKFVATVLDEYTLWTCEIVERKTINVQDWIKENYPNWLKENDNESNKICRPVWYAKKR